MKKSNLTITFDSEKLAAVKMYLGQKGVAVEDELHKALEGLYSKQVPANVREFLELRDQNPKAFVRKNKETSASPGPHEGEDRSGSA